MSKVPSKLNLSGDSSPQTTSMATRSTSELHLEAGSNGPVRQQIVTENPDRPESKKSHNSPSSPRNLKGLFSPRSERQDKSVNPAQGGLASTASSGEVNRPFPAVRPYANPANDSVPSLHHGAPADEVASAKSGASGVHEGLRSDENINRIKTADSANIVDQAGQRGEGMARKNSQRQNKSLKPSTNRRYREETDPKTAPLRPERGFHDALAAQQHRNRSADRSAIDSEDEGHFAPKNSSFTSQGSFFTNFKHHGSRAADGIGKAGKGFWGKFGRSGSANEKESSPSPALAADGSFRVIQRPLVQQTRITRIRKTMDMARDKTEYWMPALPYRAIDYLNHHGVHSEGLYRVPGGATEIKALQRRFDTGPYYDTDLLEDEMPPDVNAVASMMKAWLRDLPELLLSKEITGRIIDKCPDLDKTPQLMRDELSKLPPYNYYLLFAITCHISLLHSHSKENKMDYHALSVCFQPCMQIDLPIFQLLVFDWRNCWQGCWTESEYLQEEQDILESRTTPSEGSMHTMHSKQPSSQPNSRPTTSRSPERRVPLHTGPPPQPPPPPPPSASSESRGAERRQEPQPFSQDLRGNGKMFASRQQSPPPKLEPVQNVSPMRM